MRPELSTFSGPLYNCIINLLPLDTKMAKNVLKLLNFCFADCENNVESVKVEEKSGKFCINIIFLEYKFVRKFCFVSSKYKHIFHVEVVWHIFYRSWCTVLPSATLFSCRFTPVDIFPCSILDRSFQCSKLGSCMVLVVIICKNYHIFYIPNTQREFLYVNYKNTPSQG